MASTEDQHDQPGTGPDDAVTPGLFPPPEPAPKRTRARKTARKTARKSPEVDPTNLDPAVDADPAPDAQPAVDPASVDSAVDAGAPVPQPSVEADEPEPARPARKRTSRKKASAAPAKAQSVDAQTEAPAADAVTEEPTPDMVAEPEPSVDEQDALAQPSGEQAPAGGAGPVVPSFSLLFRAPVVPQTPASDAWSDPEADLDADPESDADTDADTDAEAGPAETSDTDESGDSASGRRRRRRGGRGRRTRADGAESAEAEGTDGETDAGDAAAADTQAGPADAEESEGRSETGSRRRTRRRRRSGGAGDADESPGVVTRVRERRDEVVGVRGSTRLEAKKQRRREGREAGRRRQIITEAEFLARRESVERVMVVRTKAGRTQIGVIEDGVLVEHFVSREANASMAGNIYLGKVQNVLPSMEAAFVDVGRGRNAVLYAGEVNWDAAGMQSGAAKRIENALEPGQAVLVQVTKDPIGHKGARLTSQISLPGRFLVYVPDSSMTGISRKLPDTERSRLKRILRDVVPETAGVIVRTAAEGASETELRADVERLTATWEQIKAKAESAAKKKGGAPLLLHGEPDLTVRVIRDVFNEDFAQLVVSGDSAWAQVNDYVTSVAPDLAGRLVRWTSDQDVFAHHRIDEQIAKAMDRKVWLPSGGSLVIDRTEAMTVVDVNTGKFVGSGGNLEETVTRNNIEAAEEIVRQLRLRDIGGIIVIDFIDMVLESNRDLVVRRLLECLGRDRTKHQVAEVTSLGLVQMTRKRVGTGLLEAFSESCPQCYGRGYLVHAEPVEKPAGEPAPAPTTGSAGGNGRRSRRSRSGTAAEAAPPAAPTPGGPTPAQIAAAAHAAAIKSAHAAVPQGDDADAAHLESTEVAAEPALEATASMEPVEVGEPVELGEPNRPVVSELTEASETSEVADAATAEATTAEASTAEATTAETADDEDPQSSSGRRPAPGRRRRRGRVVAPAGPPRSNG